ncbi:MAG TPA: hypothetical protein DCQ64_10770 [Candidatus Rokubacteria bacterium]|nr:hypothetical protein [Candidatus Rokubacteria bacterium]
MSEPLPSGAAVSKYLPLPRRIPPGYWFRVGWIVVCRHGSMEFAGRRCRAWVLLSVDGRSVAGAQEATSWR